MIACFEKYSSYGEHIVPHTNTLWDPWRAHAILVLKMESFISLIFSLRYPVNLCCNKMVSLWNNLQGMEYAVLFIHQKEMFAKKAVSFNISAITARHKRIIFLLIFAGVQLIAVYWCTIMGWQTADLLINDLSHLNAPNRGNKRIVWPVFITLLQNMLSSGRKGLIRLLAAFTRTPHWLGMLVMHI